MDNTKRPKPEDTQLRALKHLRLLPENSARGPEFRRERCWGYVSVFEYTSEKLILKSIFPLKVAAVLLSDSRKSAVGG